MKLQFFITICLSFFTAGWYVVTKGKSLSAALCFRGLRAVCLESKVTSDKELAIYFFGYPRASRCRLKFARHSSNVVFDESVVSSLIHASPLIKPLFTPGGCMARGKMGILKGFRRLVYQCIKESYFVL